MPPYRPLEVRFWEKVDQSSADGCWEWTAHRDRHGYGRISTGLKSLGNVRLAAAHRVAYELLVGPIPRGMEIDHLCRNRACVNPAHLEPVTGRENVMRGVGPTAVNAVKTQCANGHPFDDENTYTMGGTRRYCRTCNRSAQSRRRARLRGAPE